MRATTDQDGFTLAEVMVVVLIIGILLAVSIPTFLGARAAAHDRKVESDLTALVTAILPTVWEGRGDEITKNSLRDEEIVADVTFVGGSAQSHDETYISFSASAELVVIAMRSASGTCYFIRVSPTEGVAKGTKATRYCSANNTNGTAAEGW